MCLIIRLTEIVRSAMSSYKLYYFNFRGRAEIVRLAFALGNIPYEDIRLDWEQWPAEKASGRPPFGQMPFIVLPDGKVIAQSGAISKFVCTLAGFCPSDLMEKTQADMIFDGVEDLRTAMSKFYFEENEAKKEELRKEFFNKILPEKLACFQKLFQANDGGKGFFVGQKLSYADVNFFDVFNSLIAKGELKVPDELKPFPLLVDHYNRVMNIPEIKAWIEKRPKSNI